MMCTIDGESFYAFIKHMGIGNLGTLCNVTNNDTGMYDTTNMDKLVQGNSDSMSATKKGKL